MKSFVHTAHPARIVFGAGTLDRVADEVGRAGGSQVLLIASGSLAGAADRVAAALGPALAARFDGAAMHTPVEVTEQALAVLRECGADCLVALGGGSTAGLAKALALRTGLPQVVLPTTYAGSEVTPVLGETKNGRKTTQTTLAVLPGTVIYDVELTLGLPVPVTVTSAVNSLAHAVEALYAPDANPVTDAMALEAVRGISRALPVVAANPGDLDARADLLSSAWLAGQCLGAVGMGLHHKLCHTLGGSFGLPHAQTHTVVLPHAMAYNAPAVPEVMHRIADALGTPDAPGGVHDLVSPLGVPMSLRELGLAEADLVKAAQEGTARPYPNPRELRTDALEALLRRAWLGERPGG